MKKISLQNAQLAMFLSLILTSILIVFLLSVNTITKFLNVTKGQDAMTLANIVANDHVVTEALLEKEPSKIIQPHVEQIRAYSDVEFIVVMNMASIRYSHSNESYIGQRFTGGDETLAMNGKSYLSEATGISGKSIRAFVPVIVNSEQVGVVAVGFFNHALENILAELVGPMKAATLIAILLSIVGAFIITNHIKKQIFGLEPSEIALVLKERETMINSMRDGVISVDVNGCINLINGEARRIIGVKEDENVIGRPVSEIIPNSRLNTIIKSEIAEYDREQILNDSIIITNRVPIVVDSKITGAMAFFKDRTDVYKMAEELTGVKEYADALRAKSHEFMNQLQTVAGLLELNETKKALEVITSTSTIKQEQMNKLREQFQSPELIGILLGKMSICQEAKINLMISCDSKLSHLPFYFDSNRLITVVGNLIQNSIDALRGMKLPDKKIDLTIIENENIQIKVSNNGPGISSDIISKIFEKGFSTKGEGRGIGLHLVKNIVNSVNGTIEIISSNTGTEFLIEIPGGINIEKID